MAVELLLEPLLVEQVVMDMEEAAVGLAIQTELLEVVVMVL